MPAAGRCLSPQVDAPNTVDISHSSMGLRATSSAWHAHVAFSYGFLCLCRRQGTVAKMHFITAGALLLVIFTKPVSYPMAWPTGEGTPRALVQ